VVQSIAEQRQVFQRADHLWFSDPASRMAVTMVTDPRALRHILGFEPGRVWADEGNGS
jgi:hypothetical protein